MFGLGNQAEEKNGQALKHWPVSFELNISVTKILAGGAKTFRRSILGAKDQGWGSQAPPMLHGEQPLPPLLQRLPPLLW